MTHEEKLDLILDRCRRNLSEKESLSVDWVHICRKVANDSTDLNCRLFRTYVEYLEAEKMILQVNHMPRYYDATLEGLIFEGFTAKKNRIEFERNQVTNFQEFQKTIANDQKQMTL